MSEGTSKIDPRGEGDAASVFGAPAARARLRRLLMGILGILAVFAVWQVLTSLLAFTDDAYVTSDFIAVATQVTGIVARVGVEDNQEVRKGDLLAALDDTPFKLAVDGQQAALQVAVASLDAARDAVSAAQAALANGAGDAVALEQANRAQAMRAAAVSQAQAALDLAGWQLTQTRIRAPGDGTVNNLDLRPGDMATAQRPLVGLVAARGWRIVANYKENYIAGLREGDMAWVWLDTHPWRLYRARVAGIARGISRSDGESRLLPYVAPTTDWIRLKRRFPVTLTLVDPPPGLTLYMGADASVVIVP